jgi:hypothetical protein
MQRDLLAMLDVGDAANPPPGMESGPPRKGRKGRAPYLGRDRDRPLKVTVTPAEKLEIDAKAKEAGLSVASYLRACALGRQVHSVLDLRAVNDLVKVAGDQGRLGGLLKLWLVDQPGRGAPEIEVRRLLDKIGDAQAALAEIVGRV